MKAIAVIGMNYGDEGKGHITNFFSDLHTLNIRFNGGAQAAHSVFLSDGRHHIFHHFGSGSMRGARTLLSHHFIVNPIIFSQEFAALAEKEPRIADNPVFIDPRCIITTPFDMLINSFTSWYRKKNDTCGLGINETIERSKYHELVITMRDVMDKTPKQLMRILERIQHEYVPYRLQKLSLAPSIYDEYFLKKLEDPARTIEQYLNVIKFMMEHVYVWHDSDLIDKYIAKDPANRKLVFEGAQGMLLDQNRVEYMPFLTRSNTGIRNVLTILNMAKPESNLHTFLVTRAYLTRHGEGPMFHESDLGITDVSNPENPYQGRMRYGRLNYEWYAQAIEETKKVMEDKAGPKIKGRTIGVAMTCTDQVDVDPKNFANVTVVSSGPTEKDIIIK